MAIDSAVLSRPSGPDASELDSRATWLARTFARKLSLAETLAFTALAAILTLLTGLGLAPGWAPSGLLALGFGFAATLTFVLSGLYGMDAFDGLAPDEARRIANSLVRLAFVILAAGLIFFRDRTSAEDVAEILIWFPVLFAASLLTRTKVRSWCLQTWPERLLIIGAGKTGQDIAARVLGQGKGFEIVGFVDDDPMPLDSTFDSIPIYAETGDLGNIVSVSRATRIVLAFSRRPAADVLNSIREATGGSIPISVVPRLHEMTPAHATLSEIEGIPVLNLTSRQLSRGPRLAKRTIDVVLASVGIVVFAPVLAICALAIKLDSPGPVLFRQERLGRDGRPFRIMKFRTMRVDAEDERFTIAHLNEMEGAGPLFKMKEDPRVTRVGRFLRRTSLDELPQLFNVLENTMSIVGPRPFVTHEALQIDGWRARRLDLTPGITGLWQVCGRNEVPFDEMVRLDYMYVANWSLWWDFRIMLKTIPSVLSRKGAH